MVAQARRNPKPAGILGLVAVLALGTSLGTAQAQTVQGIPIVSAPAGGSVVGGAAVLPTAIKPAPVQTGAGYLHFYLEEATSGPIHSWQIRVLNSRDNPGFQPFETVNMREGQSIRFDLWPGRYDVEVYHQGKLQFSDGLVIEPGERQLVWVDFGYLSSRVRVAETEAEADALLSVDDYSAVRGVADNFVAPQVALPGGFTGQWHGPINRGTMVGSGELVIQQNGVTYATMPSAQALPGGFQGNIVFADQRVIDRQPIPGPTLADGTVTTWPDGRRFTGVYDGIRPSNGLLTYADGSAWQGMVLDGQASGAGRLVASGGSWLEVGSPQVPNALTGQYRCGRAGDQIGTPCYYIAGQQVSEAQYLAYQANGGTIATASGPAIVVPPAVVPRVATPGAPVVSAASMGCAAPVGNFFDAAGERKLVLQNNGRGSLLQTNVDGPAESFSVSFSWSGTADSMYFDYDTGEFRASTGEVVQRTTIPDEAGACSYDGTMLHVNGASYRRI